MKKILLFLLLIPVLCFGQMKKEVLKSPGGLWYAKWTPTVSDPLNRVAIVCIGGSGEWGSYAAADMVAEVSRVTEKNGFAQDAAAGENLPFIIIAPLATGTKQADHTLIAKEIGNIAKALDVDYRFIGGLSQGGQTTAGLLFQGKTGTEISKQLPSSFLNADLFDGFFMLAGQAPMPTDPCAFPNKYVFMAHAVGDPLISIAQSFTMMRQLNSCGERVYKIYASAYQKWTNPVTYLSCDIPADEVNRFIVIPGGGHSTSWTETYNWNAKSGAGYEFRKWIEKICVPKGIMDIPGIIFLRGTQIIVKFQDGQEVILKQ